MAVFKRLKQELAYTGKIIEVYDDYLEMPNGKQVVYDLVKFKGGASILPIDNEGKIILVKQYRNSLNRETIEIPAGCYDYEGEPAIDCARRELEEEIGFVANKLDFLVEIITAIGAGTEITKIFLAQDLIKTEQNLDPEEFVEIIHMELDEVVDMILNGQIIDGKTVAAIMTYKVKYNNDIPC